MPNRLTMIDSDEQHVEQVQQRVDALLLVALELRLGLDLRVGEAARAPAAAAGCWRRDAAGDVDEREDVLRVLVGAVEARRRDRDVAEGEPPFGGAKMPAHAAGRRRFPVGRLAARAASRPAGGVLRVVLGRRTRRRRRARPGVAGEPVLPFDLDHAADVAPVDARDRRSCAEGRALRRRARRRSDLHARHASRARPPTATAIGDEAVRRGERVVGRELLVDRASSKCDFSPAASTATSVTSASPIISAAAVEAVRAGLRIAFSRASRPARAAERARRASRARDASGRTRRGASSATPMNSATMPTPIASRRVAVDGRPTNSADEQQRERRPRSRASAASGPKRARRDGGSTAPSRTAAIGGTRVARSAGRSAASTVIDDRRRAARRRSCASRTRSRLRQVDAEGDEQRVQALGEREPGKQPDHRREQADQRAPRAAPSAAPAGASRRACAACANSRVRWATVIESVLR